MLAKYYEESRTRNLFVTLLQTPDARTKHYIREIRALKDNAVRLTSIDLHDRVVALYSAIESALKDTEAKEDMKYDLYPCSPDVQANCRLESSSKRSK